MEKLTNEQLQEKLDIEKWNDSQAKGADTCGEYKFCKFCDMKEDMPCAKAYNKAEEAEVAATVVKETKTATKKTAAKKPAAKKTVSKKTK